MRGEAVETEKGETVKTEEGRRGKTRRQKMRERGGGAESFWKKVRFFLWLSFCLAMACILE